MPCEKNLREMGLFSLEKKWLWGEVPKTANPNSYKGDGARLFTMVYDARTGHNVHKLKQGV